MRVGAKYDLQDAPDAHRALEARETTDKKLTSFGCKRGASSDGETAALGGLRIGLSFGDRRVHVFCLALPCHKTSTILEIVGGKTADEAVRESSIPCLR